MLLPKPLDHMALGSSGLGNYIVRKKFQFKPA